MTCADSGSLRGHVSFEDDSGSLKDLSILKKEIASHIIDNIICDNVASKLLYDSFFLLGRYRDLYSERKEDILERRRRRGTPPHFCDVPDVYASFGSVCFRFTFSSFPFIELNKYDVKLEWSDGEAPLGFSKWHKWHEERSARKVLLNRLWRKFSEVERRGFATWNK